MWQKPTMPGSRQSRQGAQNRCLNGSERSALALPEAAVAEAYARPRGRRFI